MPDSTPRLTAATIGTCLYPLPETAALYCDHWFAVPLLTLHWRDSPYPTSRILN